MLTPSVGKLIAYHPALATKTIFGYFVREEKGKWILNVDGNFMACEIKACTIIYNKLQDGYKEI